MKSVNIRKTVIVIWLSASFLFGAGLLAPAMGIDLVPQTFACNGNGHGGGC